ncbi:TetR/AcrR family transcriptional regulator [Mycetocola tolaasinivorans]|uniref:TetR/AcrR family transcriptional regulator n=1 Tax=Mycetocola tolaasinivorans TaxID=76635 RepID=A0A3L7AAK7_9MICO|nr:TetR/AcrR family transcriptional regulator [Mycetocola tolaasinivorans]RLP77004.1 TetR/AcrR family transcriptional regulator [Mycetocola tolaasinivorans]
MTAETPQPRPLRADAERNRAILLSVAGELFAENGTGGSLEDVARRAGVGIGTLYRRFPTRDDLIVALYAEQLAHFAVILGDAVRFADQDADRAFRAFVHYSIELQSADRGFSDVILDGYDAPRVFRDEHAAIHAGIAELFRIARTAGALRRDVSDADFPLVLRATAHLGGAPERSDELARLAGLLISALTGDSATPLPER